MAKSLLTKSQHYPPLLHSDVLVEMIQPKRMRGGAHVGTDNGVLVTHIPTGIRVGSTRYSQHQNRVWAMAWLRILVGEQNDDTD